MTFRELVKADFERAYRQSGYPGHFKKVLHTVTNAGFQAVFSYRVCRWLMQHHIPLLGAVLQRLAEVWTGVSIPPEAKIGPGLLILHFGGIMINSRAVLGSNCTLHHEVTIGNKNPGGGSPVLGDNVTVGAGAKVLGEIQIGDGAVIGANAVVLISVPAGATAAGVPAKVLGKKT